MDHSETVTMPATPISLQTIKENKVIAKAIHYLETRFCANPQQFTSSLDVRMYLRLQLAQEKNEVFGAMFLDSRHRLLAFERLFSGSIDSSTVYPRVVVQRALAHNAARVILTHNHPSGISKPSEADREITQLLKKALALVQVEILDHMVVAPHSVCSMRELELL
jgi:DNA repair protein RadC